MAMTWEQICQKLEYVKQLYRNDRLLQVSRILDSIQNHLQSLESKKVKTVEQTQLIKKTNALLQTAPFARILTECEEVKTLRQSLHSKQGWILSYDGSDTSVWYRREPNTSSHSILTEGIICAPLVNVASLIYEADLYQSLFWYVTSARSLKHDNPAMLRRAAHIVSYVPWPLQKRDVVVYAYAVDGLDKDDNCVMVVSRSIKDNDPVTDKIPSIGITSRTVRADMHNSGFELIPISPNQTKARFLQNVNPHLPFIPMGLINWAARTLCRWSLRVLESRARDLNSVSPIYLERISNDPIYAHIRKRLNEYWKERGVSISTSDSLISKSFDNSQGSINFNADEVPEGPPPSMISAMIRGDDSDRTETERRGRFFGSRLRF